MLCRFSQVVQRNVEHHKNKHKHRVSAAYQAFLPPLLPLLELLHHKRKAVRTRGHQGCDSTLRLRAYSQQNVHLVHHAQILLGHQARVCMVTIR